MGREIRRVPPNWEHPKYSPYDRYQGYRPLLNSTYREAIADWVRQHLLWEQGKHPDQNPEYIHYADYAGDAPQVGDYRPDWKEGEATWFQVYETVTEGTPVTPPFKTQDELINYLCNYGDEWDQSRGNGGWDRTAAERFVKEVPWAPSGVFIPGVGFMTGVEALGKGKL